MMPLFIEMFWGKCNPVLYQGQYGDLINFIKWVSVTSVVNITLPSLFLHPTRNLEYSFKHKSMKVPLVFCFSHYIFRLHIIEKQTKIQLLPDKLSDLYPLHIQNFQKQGMMVCGVPAITLSVCVQQLGNKRYKGILDVGLNDLKNNLVGIIFYHYLQF